MNCAICKSDDVKQLVVLSRGPSIYVCHACEYAFTNPATKENDMMLKLAQKRTSGDGLFSRIVDRLRARRRIPGSVIELYRKINHLLPSNPVILEAGAHMGYDTYGLSKMWSGGTIHAFEPVPSIYEELKDRVGKCNNVKMHHLALGDKEESVTMHVSGGQSSGSSSILKPTKHLEIFPEVSFQNSVSVKVVTLRDWAKANNVSKIDLMWLDMQGYEVNALRGAGDILSTVSVIYTELCKDELYQGLTTRDAYIDFLDSKGFYLLFMSSPDEVIGDGIFVNKNLLGR